jgi:hypothetical protein
MTDIVKLPTAEDKAPSPLNETSGYESDEE